MEVVEVRWSIGNGWFRWPHAVPWPVLLGPHPCLTLVLWKVKPCPKRKSAGGVAARVGFCPVITASQVLAGRPARDPWLGRRRRLILFIFVGAKVKSRAEEGSVYQTVPKDTPHPPQLTDTLPNPVGGDRCISPSLRPRYLFPQLAGRSDPIERVETNPKNRRISSRACRAAFLFGILA